MSDDSATTPVPKVPEVPAKSPPPPLRPINLLAASIFGAVLLYNMHLDAGSDAYDGARQTYGLIAGMCLSLGLDFDRFWPRRGG